MPKRFSASRSGRLSLGLLRSLAITYFVPSRRPKWLQRPTLDERFGREQTQDPAHTNRKTTQKKRLRA